MTGPARWSLTSPWVVFPALALVLVLAAIFRPAEPVGDPRLSSYSAAPAGAKALHDAAAKLGWRPARRTRPFAGRFATPIDSSATFAVLAPVEPVTPAEAHALLDAVRAGAGLLVAVSADDALTGPLTDSLRLDVDEVGFQQIVGGDADSVYGYVAGAAGDDDAAPRARAASTDPFGSVCRDGGGVGGSYVRRVLKPRGVQPRDTVSLLVARGARRESPVALGRPLGRGRVMVVSDAALLRNDVLRLCGAGAAAQPPAVRVARMLAWASPAPGALVFDEYHQGHHGGLPEDDSTGAVAYALTRTPWGRALGVAVLASLLALWGAGARALAPVGRTRIERRSPLEHVGALARAYQQAGASRTTTRRLVRGLRRRHPAAARRGATDDAFLEELAARDPSIERAVALVRRGSERQLASAELVAVGQAIDEIEQSIARPAAPRR